jgi:hypothetical protein
MKVIKLTRNKQALVDDEDFDKLSKYKWTACLKRKNPDKLYELWVAVRGIKSDKTKTGRTNINMHQMIMGFPAKQIDHINHNSLDNRQCNLRLVTPTENAANKRKQKNNKSGYRGVWFDKDLKKFRAAIRPHNKTIHLGCFLTKEEAATMWNQEALKYWGKYACLNIV